MRLIPEKKCGLVIEMLFCVLELGRGKENETKKN